MPQVKLALVGRPNVGKSALFNRLCGKRLAIVDDFEGTTRDRLYGEGEFLGKRFSLIDTGGITSEGDFHEEIRRQAEIAIEEADTLVMVVDGRTGPTPADREIARLLLRSKKPLCLAVNKVDDLSKVDLLHQFYGLGIARMVPVSASQGFQMLELLEMAFLDTPLVEAQEKDLGIRVAIVGRPNVGKSTLLNHLLQEERSVVSPLAGTTRDSIDAQVVR